MEEIQMTQIGANNYMIYEEGDEAKLCKISQTYPNSKLVDIVCLDDNRFVETIDYTIKLKPIGVCEDVIKKLGFSLNRRKNYPQLYGHTDNIVFDLVYKDKLSKMVVHIYDLYYILLHDTTTFFKADFPLCVHHLQNLKSRVGDKSSDDEVSLISLLKEKVLIKSHKSHYYYATPTT